MPLYTKDEVMTIMERKIASLVASVNAMVKKECQPFYPATIKDHGDGKWTITIDNNLCISRDMEQFARDCGLKIVHGGSVEGRYDWKSDTYRRPYSYITVSILGLA